MADITRGWQLGVEFRIEPSGFGRRERDGVLWFTPSGGSRTAINKDQLVAIINDTALPLWGWDKPPPANWLENPRRTVDPAKATPIDALLAMQLLQDSASALHGSLIGYAQKKQVAYLAQIASEARHLSSQLREPDLDLACTGDLRLKADIDGYADSCLKMAERFEFWASEVATWPKFKAALMCLVEPVAKCFETLYRKPATGGWKQRRPQSREEADAYALNEPDSAFLRFFRSYCVTIGCTAKPLTLQAALYDYKRAAARLDSSSTGELDSQTAALQEYRVSEAARASSFADSKA